MTVDPLQGLNVSSENYDIHRVASVYYNSDGSMAWTKARFNDRDKAEPSVPVSVAQAWDFARGKINLNDWLARFYGGLQQGDEPDEGEAVVLIR